MSVQFGIDDARKEFQLYVPNFGRGEFRCPAFHFRVPTSNNRIAYTYIRKNACSAFKHLIGEHPHPLYRLKSAFGLGAGGLYSIRGNLSNFRISESAMRHKYELRLFVYRDPVERFVSLFINKFIDQTWPGTLFDNFKALTGKDPGNCSFRDFVAYSQQDFGKLDSHMWPQKAHLLDVEYLPIPMTNLRSLMERIIGQDLAQKHFAIPHNQTRSDDREVMNMLDEVSVGDLRTFRDRGLRIAKNNFIDNTLVAYIQNRYSGDYEMLKSVRFRQL